jgi:hypothetical protein
MFTRSICHAAERHLGGGAGILQDRDTLMTIAQIAATFIGFAGVVFAVESASSRGVSDRERNAILNLLIPSVAVLFIAFVPLVAAAAGGHDVRIWRASNAVVGVVHSVLLTGAFRAALRNQLLEPIPVRFLLLGGGSLAVLANAVVVLGFFPQLAATAFLAGLVWFLFVSAVQFLMFIVLHVRAS